MNKSSSVAALAAALAKAQAVLIGAKKDAANPFFKSTYADLQSVWDACRQPLASNGLSVVQTMDMTEFGPVLVTTLMHASGEWIEGRLPIWAVKQDPQGLGSAITYARRYALAAIVGIYQTDDDAESAMDRAPRGGNVTHAVNGPVNQVQQQVPQQGAPRAVAPRNNGWGQQR
jgi:hypothetical protein